mgnify:CR=1 FL=1
MQYELIRLKNELGITFIYVTHDQVEALTMSTKIAIFREGIIIQVAHPLELYNNPANLYVADLSATRASTLLTARQRFPLPV